MAENRVLVEYDQWVLVDDGTPGFCRTCEKRRWIAPTTMTLGEIMEHIDNSNGVDAESVRIFSIGNWDEGLEDAATAVITNQGGFRDSHLPDDHPELQHTLDHLKELLERLGHHFD